MKSTYKYLKVVCPRNGTFDIYYANIFFISLNKSRLFKEFMEKLLETSYDNLDWAILNSNYPYKYKLVGIERQKRFVYA